MPKNDKIPTDLVDELRSNLNKIGKLAPDLDAWQHHYDAMMSKAVATNNVAVVVTTEEQTHAALAILTAIDQMRTTLRLLKGFALDTADAKIEQDKAAQDAFFDRVDE